MAQILTAENAGGWRCGLNAYQWTRKMGSEFSNPLDVKLLFIMFSFDNFCSTLPYFLSSRLVEALMHTSVTI